MSMTEQTIRQQIKEAMDCFDRRDEDGAKRLLASAQALYKRMQRKAHEPEQEINWID